MEGGYQAKADPNVSICWAPAELWKEARAITSPILIIRAGQGTVLDAATLRRMEEVIEPARPVTLDRAGHNTFVDMEPEFLSAAAELFLAHGG